MDNAQAIKQINIATNMIATCIDHVDMDEKCEAKSNLKHIAIQLQKIKESIREADNGDNYEMVDKYLKEIKEISPEGMGKKLANMYENEVRLILLSLSSAKNRTFHELPFVSLYVCIKTMLTDGTITGDIADVLRTAIMPIDELMELFMDALEKASDGFCGK